MNAADSVRMKPIKRHLARPVAVRRGNDQQARQRHGEAEPLVAPRPLAEQRPGQQQREEGLGLHHDRGHARGHAELQAEEQQPELAQALRQPVGRRESARAAPAAATNSSSGKAAAAKRSAPSSIGLRSCRPSFMATKFRPQISTTLRARGEVAAAEAQARGHAHGLACGAARRCARP